jgi:hypothetical protein
VKAKVPVLDAKKRVTTLKPDEIPSICPMPACGEKVPQSPDPFLLSLFKLYRDHAELSKQGKKLAGRVHLLARICYAITEYWEDSVDGQDMTATTASEHGWPLEIDFEQIPQRIMNYKNHIDAIVADQFVLNNSEAWQTFLTLLKGANCKLADFQGIGDWAKFRAVGTNVHAG